MRKIKNVKDLSVKAFDIRRDALDIIMAGGGGHIGGDMSEPEILLTLYERMNSGKSRQPRS